MSQLTGPILIFPGDSVARHSTPQLTPGTRALDNVGREHVYIQASGAIATGAPVTASANFVAGSGVAQNPFWRASQSADVKGFVGVAEAAFTATQCGFIVERGPVVALVPSGVAVGDPVTAGNGALSTTLTNAIRFATVLEAAPVLSGTTQLKLVNVN